LKKHSLRQSEALDSARRASLRVETVALVDLRPHPENPRQHPKPGTPEWESLKASLTHDYYDPIVVNTGTADPALRNMLVSGHLRVKVLSASGYTHADAVMVDYDAGLHKARMLSANKLQGQDDAALLKDLLEELDAGQTTDTGQLLADLTGFDAAERERLALQVHQESGEGTEKNMREQWLIVVTCRDELHQTELLDKFLAEGIECKALQS